MSGLAPGMFRIIPVSLDPSVAGLPGAVGDVAQSADGLHAWARSGPLITDWSVAPGGSGGFGSDVTVNLPNSALANVKALELVAALTTNTPGSEVSSWTATVLVAGAQVPAFVATGNAFLVPIGTIALPGFSFQGHTGSGISYDVGTGAMFVSIGGVQQFAILGAGAYAMHQDASKISMGTLNQGLFGMNGLDAQVYSNLGNVEIGTDGAVATNSATLHLTIPSCAGTPTGTVVPKSGKVALIYDTSANKLWASAGGGTWKSVTLA